MPFNIVRNDITRMKVDAIVNASNTELLMGDGVSKAIFYAAGAVKLHNACKKLAPICTGTAVITKGFALPAKYIVHTAGPYYQGGNRGEETLLRSCYVNSLEVAKTKGCKSIAFPLISSGLRGYPKDEALKVANGAIIEWLTDNDMDVSLVVFDRKAFILSQELINGVKSFIDDNFDDRFFYSDCHCLSIEALPLKALKIDKALPAPGMRSEVEFENTQIQLGESFADTLLRIIDNKGRTDVDVYKRANIDRKLFSKIRSGTIPRKKTVIALAVALELSLPETRILLERAGFALSRSLKFDVIVEYFITHSRYNIYEINNVLFVYNQPLLGG